LAGDVMGRIWHDGSYLKAKTKRDAVLVFVLIFAATVAVLAWR